jgi:hypothetical protein
MNCIGQKLCALYIFTKMAVSSSLHTFSSMPILLSQISKRTHNILNKEQFWFQFTGMRSVLRIKKLRAYWMYKNVINEL